MNTPTRKYSSERRFTYHFYLHFPYVDIREFYFSQSRGELKVLPHGVALSFDEWYTLVNFMPFILEDFPNLASTVLCHDNPDHHNSQGALNSYCSVCNSFHDAQERYYVKHPL